MRVKRGASARDESVGALHAPRKHMQKEWHVKPPAPHPSGRSAEQRRCRCRHDRPDSGYLSCQRVQQGVEHALEASPARGFAGGAGAEARRCQPRQLPLIVGVRGAQQAEAGAAFSTASVALAPSFRNAAWTDRSTWVVKTVATGTHRAALLPFGR